MAISRREFSKLLGGAGALAAATQLGRSAAMAQTTGGYRAMVGVFLFGGNDAWNMVVPNDARYAGYAASRGSGIALAQSKLSLLSGSAFGLHPAFAPLQTAWSEGALNVVLNTGTLFQPLTKALYQSRPDLQPLNLMSHADEQSHWQGLRARDVNLDGFMGRIADRLGAANFPQLMSIGGSTLALIGHQSSPLVVSSTGTMVRNGYNVAATDAPTLARQAGLNAFSASSGLGEMTSLTGQGISSSYGQAVTANTILTSTTSTTDQYFKDPTTGAALTSDVAHQLMRVARLVEARGTLGHTQQVFFASQGGYDTHSGQVAAADTSTGLQAGLFSDLANALAGFYSAMKGLGVQDEVTAFTMSDFGRVFKANAQLGTDHAWGSNHLVIGGAVKDQQVIGAYPDTTLGGQDDAIGDGRWIPTIAQEEYIGAIAQWFGVAAADMPYVFPNWATWSGGGRGPIRCLADGLHRGGGPVASRGGSAWRS